MGLLPILAVILLGMWQIGLVGYTYMLAGHAAREGARELATDPTDDEKKPKLNPYERPGARGPAQGLARAARRSRCPATRTTVRPRVRVELEVPVVIPGLGSGFTIASSADTTIESEDLPPSQQLTPTQPRRRTRMSRHEAGCCATSGGRRRPS